MINIISMFITPRAGMQVQEVNSHIPSEARSLLGLRQKSMASPIFLAFL